MNVSSRFIGVNPMAETGIRAERGARADILAEAVLPKTREQVKDYREQQATKYSPLSRMNPFAPAIAPEYKTSVGLLKSVTEGRNWERPTVNDKATEEAKKYTFAREEHPNDKYWAKNHKGISDRRTKNRMPDAYYNYEFDEYNTKSDAWTRFKNEKGWVKPQNLQRLSTKGKGRFYATHPALVRNTFKTFQNSYLKGQVNDYTRRFKQHTAEAQKKWSETTSAKSKAVKQKLADFDKEYKNYLSTLLGDVKKAYDASVESQMALARLELEKEAEALEAATGYHPGAQSRADNEKKAKNVKLTNALKAAAAASGVVVAGVATAAASSGLPSLNIFAAPPANPVAAAAAPSSLASTLSNIFTPAAAAAPSVPESLLNKAKKAANESAKRGNALPEVKGFETLPTSAQQPEDPFKELPTTNELAMSQSAKNEKAKLFANLNPLGNAKPVNAKPANAKPVNAKPVNAKPANAKGGRRITYRRRR
jgi:hypothetical protein